MGITSFLRDNAPFLLAGAVLSFCSSFGQTFFISIFAGNIRAEFGLGHGGWGAIYTAGTLASAVVMLWAGGLTDRFRVRALGPAMLALLVLACLVMAAAPAAWVLVPAVFLLRFLGQGMMSHIAYVAMARWFVATRGRAVAVAALGFSLGEAVLPLTFVALMEIWNWRVLWLLAALLPLAAIPLLRKLLTLERTPQSVAAETPSPGMQGRYWTRADALRHPVFWLILPVLLGAPAFGTAFLFQQVHLATVKGWAHVELVALFPIYTVTAIGAVFAAGALMDRVGATRLLPVYQLPLVLFFLAMPLVERPAAAGVVMVLFGLTQGAQNPIATGIGAELYGTRHLGSIKAALTAVMVLGSALGPGLTGWAIDRGVSFPAQMPWIAGYLLAASALAGLAVTLARRRSAAAA